MATRVTIKGLDSLNKKVNRLPRTTLSFIRAAMERKATQVANQIRRAAPRGETGNLKKSVGWTWGKAPRGSVRTRVGSKTALGTAQELNLTLFAGDAKAFYARFVEFGTVRAPPHPFFGPIYRANRKGITAAIKSAVSQALRQEAKSVRSFTFTSGSRSRSVKG